MTLIDCPECGNHVSDNAALCPACGHRLGMGKRIRLAILITLIMLVAAFAAPAAVLILLG